jgi:DNA-binding response OmpR family regulator
VDPATHEVSGGADRSFTLSGRELEVLVRLMEARGDVVPRQDLLSDIWGDDHRSEAVLDTTVHRLRRKLEEQISRPDLVATVRGVGYRLRTG